MKKMMIVMMVLFLISCQKSEIVMHHDVIEITGDVETELRISTGEDALDSLFDIIQKSKPFVEQSTVIFSSYDGVMAEIPLDELKQAKLLHTEESGWEVESPLHPPQSGIRNLEKIIVRANVIESEQPCFRIMQGEVLLNTWSYGDFLLEKGNLVAIEEGSAKKNDFEVTAYTERKVIGISNYLETEHMIGYFKDGSQKELLSDGYLEWRGNEIDYLTKDLKSREEALLGLWGDPPEASIVDIKKKVLTSIQDGPVILILIDGFGDVNYRTLENELDFLRSHESYEVLRTVMPSVSTVSLAAMLTGEYPKDNGIVHEGERGLKVEDIFKTLKDQGKTSLCIEGNTKMITLSTEARLHLDRNDNESNDDEVYEGSLEAIKENVEFIFIHFHGYDDVAHSFGPESEEAVQKIKEIDSYIETIYSTMNGTLYITADHGQHDITGVKKGEHGEFRPEDMRIPLMKWRKR